MFKWILGVGGYILTRNFLGAILGFSIGTFIDNYRTIAKNGGAQGGTYYSSDDIFSFYQQRFSKS